MVSLLATLGLWFVVLFSLRVALWGNPLYRFVSGTDRTFLAQVESAIGKGGAERAVTAREASFIRTFSRFTMLELAMMVLELAMLIYLWLSRTMVWLSLALLAKNLILMLVSALVARTRKEQGLFVSLTGLPPWLVWTDRVSALASGLGCLVLMLVLNGVVSW